MTDESHSPESEDQSQETPSTGEVADGSGPDFSSGEGLVAFAGIVLLAAWILFDLLIDNYGFDNMIAVVAAAAAIVPRLNRDTVEKVHRLPVIMKLLGWTLVFLGIVEIILDIRFAIFDDFGVVIGALVSYAGYAMAFMGARSIEI